MQRWTLAEKILVPLGFLVLVGAFVLPVPDWVSSSVLDVVDPEWRDDPLDGMVVFGDTFDARTFELQGQRSSARIGQDTVFIAHPTRTIADREPVSLLYLWDGVEWDRGSDEAAGDWDVFGSTIPGVALDRPGVLTVRVFDVGNTLLAEGHLEVTSLETAPLSG